MVCLLHICDTVHESERKPTKRTHERAINQRKGDVVTHDARFVGENAIVYVCDSTNPLALPEPDHPRTHTIYFMVGK